MRFELPQDRRQVYQTRIPIRWGDMDAMGHVNNTIYFRYLEIVRVEWFDQFQAAPNPKGQGPVIVNACCTFHKQLEYPGEVLAKLFVSNPGRSSFEECVTLERVDQPGLIYASGGATVVWTDFPTQKSVPLPEDLRALLV